MAVLFKEPSYEKSADSNSSTSDGSLAGLSDFEDNDYPENESYIVEFPCSREPSLILRKTLWFLLKQTYFNSMKSKLFSGHPPFPLKLLVREFMIHQKMIYKIPRSFLTENRCFLNYEKFW